MPESEALKYGPKGSPEFRGAMQHLETPEGGENDRAAYCKKKHEGTGNPGFRGCMAHWQFKGEKHAEAIESLAKHGGLADTADQALRDMATSHSKTLAQKTVAPGTALGTQFASIFKANPEMATKRWPRLAAAHLAKRAFNLNEASWSEILGPANSTASLVRRVLSNSPAPPTTSGGFFSRLRNRELRFKEMAPQLLAANRGAKRASDDRPMTPEDPSVQPDPGDDSEQIQDQPSNDLRSLFLIAKHASPDHRVFGIPRGIADLFKMATPKADPAAEVAARTGTADKLVAAGQKKALSPQ